MKRNVISEKRVFPTIKRLDVDSCGGQTVSVVVPAYNEENRIAKTLADLAENLPGADIIVVLNGCRDGTRSIVDGMKARFDNIRYVDIEAAVGKGGAIRVGALLSRADLIAYVDADGATSGQELRRLIEIAANFDAVIGSRWLPGSNVVRPQSRVRRIASRGFNSLVRMLFGLRISDTQCGAKVFKADLLREIVQEVETSSLAIDVDLLYALKRRKKCVTEVATVWSDVSGSKVDIVRSSWKMFASLLRLRLRHSLLRYAVPAFDRVFPTAPVTVRSKLRILILNWRDINHPQAGGAEVYLHEQAKRWVASGHSVTWLTAGFAGASSTENVDGISVIRVGNRASVYLVLPFVYITKLRDQFDILIDAENGIPFFSPLFSMKPKKLLIFHVHRDVFLKHLPFPISWLFVWLETRVMPLVYRNVDLVTISDDSKADIEKYRLTARPIEVIRSGVDAQLHPGKKAGVPTIVYVGRLRAYKRIDWLIEAFSEVRKSTPDAVLKIAGTGDDADRLKAFAKQYGVDDACEFLGYVDESEKRAVLQEAWVFVSPSSMEGWGIAAIEANACGTPAIVFDCPGLREAVIDGLNGRVLSKKEELASAISAILVDDESRTALESGATARASEFSWDKTASDTLATLVRDASGTQHSVVRHDDAWHIVTRALTHKR